MAEYKYKEITEKIIGSSMKVHAAYNMQVGLLINFGSISLQFKRLENSKFKETPFPINQ